MVLYYLIITMQNTIFQNIVLDELNRRKWSRYRLAQELDGYVGSNMLYKWLSGYCRMGEDSIQAVFNVLELGVCRKRK